MSAGSFPFALTGDVTVNPKTDYLARIGAAIHDKDALLMEVAAKLRFPPYFVRPNWDAFHDWMEDLSWIGNARILLLHEAAPHLSRKELKIYLEILRDATDSLRESGRALIVAFPAQTRALLDAWGGVK